MDINDGNKQSDIQDIFDIRPAAVTKWLNTLPLGSTSELSKQLCQTLKKVNQQNNSIKDQLDFLEQIASTYSSLYPRLSKYLTDVSLPLNTNTRNVIQITATLLSEILIGYQRVLKTLITKKPFGWKKPFSLSLHRVFIYTSQSLCSQCLSYQASQKGTWREVFWCYQQAEKLKLLHKTFRYETSNPIKTSLDYEFKKLLLLSLLSANELGQKNINEVYKLMPLWIKHTNILRKDPLDKKTSFTLNLLSDVPPYLIGTRNDATCQTVDRHYLSTSKLKILISNYLDKIEAKGAIRINHNVLYKTTLLNLISHWSRDNLRTDARKEGAGFIDIITGITAIHFVLNQQTQPVYNEASTDISNHVVDFETTSTHEAVNIKPKSNTLNLDYFLDSSNQDENDWDNTFENLISGDISIANWTETEIYNSFHFSKSILLDYSKDGYRLSVNTNSIDNLKLNGLIAVRENALAPWALAQVKWLHFTEKGDLQLGARILSEHVLPVHICYQANNIISNPLPSLLGNDRNKLMLFVPVLPTNLKGKKLLLEHQNQHSQIHLKSIILNTSAFSLYEIFEKQATQSQHSSEAKKIMTSNEPEDIADNS